MPKTKQEVFDYYSELVNLIDIKCEIEIKSSKCKENNDQINRNREILIAKVRQIEQTNLESIKSGEPIDKFCFLMPSSNKLRPNLKFFKKVGHLVIINEVFK